MRIFITCFTALLLCGCKSASIAVLDCDTQEPVGNAMVFTEEYRVLGVKKRMHTTDKDGILNIDYHPMNVIAVKEGYSISYGSEIPSIIYLSDLKSPSAANKKHDDFKELEAFKADNPIYERLLKYKADYLRQSKK